MYVVTFYSYRGGVGRTMALANAAVELSKRGRKVLIVDFDLEAPGISTFDFCRSNAGSKGLVDYICDYKQTSRAPKIDDYIQRCELTSSEARAQFWIMSAGRQDEHYAEKFHSINWEQLYAEQAGFLLMENLKAQWQDCLAPDYVFIDSRTGHTDISGICTRQLPDAVVFTFFPNVQNLAGLTQVVSAARREKDGPRKKEIQMHFVASNIPNIDDEFGILRDHLEQFRAALGFSELLRIHYYPSLSIVNQDIFTMVKPNTTLAKEYVGLANSILRDNPADRDGALSYIAETLGKIQHDRSKYAADPEFEGRLDQIQRSHPADGEIHAKLGDLYFRLGDIAHATVEYEQAVKVEYFTSDVLLSLSLLYSRRDKRSEAVDLLLKLADRPSADIDVQIAILQLISLDASAVPIALESNGVKRLSQTERLKLSHVLRTRLELLPFALTFLGEAAESNSLDDATRTTAQYNIGLCKIAMGRFSEAMAEMGNRDQVVASGSINEVFNYAMAEWGQTHSRPLDLFRRVVVLSKPISESSDANYAQCLAIAAHAIGAAPAAQDWLARARELASRQHSQNLEFSCWPYLNRTITEFVEDLEKIRRMLAGEHLLPACMSEHAPTSREGD